MTGNKSPKNIRLDARVMELGLFPTRQVAQTAIMDGGILVDGQKATKPGMNISPSSTIELSPGWGAPKYVSRGGLKLEKAIDSFQVSVSGRVCIDIGASTGGFTDCLLKHGALRVYAVDVGYGQLDWTLRQDERVVVKERLNARSIEPEQIYDSLDCVRADLLVMDVSFISVTKILPSCLKVLSGKTPEIICLIKPQFEAGKSLVSKGGVVRSSEVHIQVLQTVLASAQQLNLSLIGLTHSPIKGPAGNIEYLVHWQLNGDNRQLDVPELVKSSHQELNGQLDALK